MDVDTLRADLHALLGGWPRPTAIDPPHLDRGESLADALNEAALGTGRGIEPSIDGPHPTLHRLQVVPNRRTRCDDADPIDALFVRPPGVGPFPAVLYCHAHGNDYAMGKRELVEPRRSLPAGPYGPALAARGIASLCIDHPAFGSRDWPGESARVKRCAWHGDTLFGAMLRELAAALDALETLPDVDDTRVATLGLSMGCTTAWWLAALDERVRATVGLCCVADIATLVDEGTHDLHGHYITVPGLLARWRTADIASIVAPRPWLIGHGERDPLTPPTARRAVYETLAARYASLGADERLEIVAEPDGGHAESIRMRTASLAFLVRHLRPGTDAADRATVDQSA